MEKEITRRLFLRGSLSAAAAFCLGSEGRSAANTPLQKEALFYEKLDQGRVNCKLCFRECFIRSGKRGFCRNRENREGSLYSIVYGRPASLQLDPIEKEPMFHNLPGTTILCTGTASCNFRCRFCHNWHLSQHTFEDLEPYSPKMAPGDIVDEAAKRNAGLSFTYNEPTVFYEFMYDVARLGRKKGLNTIFHTNGGMQAEPMKALLPKMNGVTVDLKGFSADYYKDVSFARMTPVLNTLKLIKQEEKWLEIVNLLVPTLNDDMGRIREMARWVRENLGSDVPIHFTRFFPAYKMQNLPPTPVATLEKARETAIAEGINYVYIGNVPGHTYNSTFCPECGKKVINRTHFSVLSVKLKNGNCQYCDHPIPGIWDT